MIPFLLWVLYLGASGFLLLIARWLRRPIPLLISVTFLSLPVAFCLRGFFENRTLLPTDHVRLFVPWMGASPALPRNANLNDAVTQLAPWAKAVRAAWGEGSFPLRNRWNGCGSPLFANGQSAALSPLTLLMMALPLAQAFTLAAALKLTLALTGMWLWLRELSLSALAALFGAVSFSFSLTLTPLLLFPMSSAIGLWPWIFFAAELLVRAESPGRPLLLLSAVLAIEILSGHPESAVLGVVAVGIFILGRRLLGERISRSVWMGLAAGAVATGLTAFVWLPQLQAIERSNRAVEAMAFRARLPLSAVPHRPAWSYGIISSLYPRALGDAVGSPMIPGIVGNFVEMTAGYFGIVGWIVALGILLPGPRRSQRELALLLVLLSGLAIGIGAWPFFEIVLQIPLLKLVFPLRFLAWVSLAGSALAAFGLDRLHRDLGGLRTERAWEIWPPVALAAGGAATFWRFHRDYEAVGGLASEKTALAVALVALFFSGALFLLYRSGRMSFSRLAVFLCAIAAAELMLQGTRLYRWSTSGEVFPSTPLMHFLQSQKGPFRVLGVGAALFPGTNVFAGVEDVRTHDPTERRDYVQFLDQTCGYDPTAYFKMIRNVNASALDFLNVRYLVGQSREQTPGSRWTPVYRGIDGTVFENPSFLPRVFSPRRVRFVRGGAGDCGDSGNRLSAFGQERARIVSRQDWLDEASVCGDVHGAEKTPEPANPQVTVTDYRETTNEVFFRARSPLPAILVASLVNDGGWSGSDEHGHRLALFSANGPFLAVSVKRGESVVQLEYSPPGFRSGVAISVVLLAAIVLLLFFNRVRSFLLGSDRAHPRKT